MENDNKMVTTLRGIKESLHWKIKEEAWRRSKAGNQTTVNDIYLELIEKGLCDFVWSE